jgi:PKHD-type hydroxylase|tara:strand:- start:69 stop:650 length:582 start_codon:yes stop_codon:yes gene_type:complete
MNLNNYYCVFKKGLPIEFCDKVIALAANQNRNKASVSNKDNTKRISNITWLDESWIYETLKPYIDKANQDCDWNLQWDYTEKAQFTEYEKDQYYKWHIDQLDKPYSERFGKDYQGKIRKLSVTISLSNPEDYDGGRLEFYTSTPYKKKIISCDQILDKGSLVIFPSFIWHQITPVIKGTRKSLVLWNLGNPYK